MNTSNWTLNLQEIFAFPFRDPNWPAKLLIAFILLLVSSSIPILPLLFLFGYMYEIAHHIIVDGGQPRLPEWTDLGKLMTNGLKLGGFTLLVSLPFILLMVIGVFLWIVPAMLMSEFYFDGAEIIMLLSTFTGVGIFTISVFLMLLTWIFLPAPMAHMVATGKFEAAFRVREWWPIFRANLGGFLVVIILYLGAFYLVSFIYGLLYMTIVLCCLIPFVSSAASAYLLLVLSALAAQVYRDGAARLAAPLAPVVE